MDEPAPDGSGGGHGGGLVCSGADCTDGGGGCIDQDGDGYGEGVACLGADCDDTDADRFPGNLEVCDGKDNDCDEAIPPDEADDDQDGTRVCDGDCRDDDPTPGGCLSCSAQDFKMYLVGNSLSRQVLTYWEDAFKNIISESGSTMAMDWHTWSGRSLESIYESPDQGDVVSLPWDEALRDVEYTTVSLQPYGATLPSDREYVGKLIDYALAKSPNARFYVFANWPDIDDGSSFASKWLSPYSGEEDWRVKDYFEQVLTAVRQDKPSIPIYLLPVGHALYELEIAGVDVQSDFFYDQVHFNNRGRYLQAVVFYSVLTGCNPDGLPTQGYGTYPGNPGVDDELAQKIWSAAWKAVTDHANLTGVVGT
jgi:hypothetical protein